MATPVIMPRQGQSVESCLIGKWHKQKGDKVEVDDLLFTYETDKATFDEKAKTAGVMLDVFFEEGDDVPVLANVCVIGETGEDTAAFRPQEQDEASGKEVSEAAGQTGQEHDVREDAARLEYGGKTETQPGTDPGRVSPRARRLARTVGADIRQARGSGPQGRIIEQDIRRLIAAGKTATPAAGAYPVGTAGTGLGGKVTLADSMAAPDLIAAADESPQKVIKHSNIRRIIASSMQASLAEMAQLTLNSSFDATDIISLRRKLKQANAQGLGQEQGFPLAQSVPTINDVILYAVSRVLRRHPECNAWYDPEKLTVFSRVHLGVAVDTPRGLMVPTIYAADSMDIASLSRAVKEAAASCQTGTINPDQLKGGTFTVTNLGTLGVESFTPVINPPQTCILGVCNMTTKVREQDGRLEPYPAIGLSLTFDHRALDGAPAARFLQDLVLTLESFTLLLIQG